MDLEKDVDLKSYQNQLWELGVFSLEKWRPRGDVITLYSSLKRGCIQEGLCIFNQAASDRSRGHSLKLLQMRFTLNVTKKFFREM